MNKRSAMLMAAGLVVALGLGAAAMSFSLGESASAEGSRAKPIVKTVRDTVTIHRQARGSNAGPAVITLQRSSDDAAGDVEDALEDAAEQDTDDAYEGEDHESEDHESDDGESDGGAFEHEEAGDD